MHFINRRSSCLRMFSLYLLVVGFFFVLPFIRRYSYINDKMHACILYDNRNDSNYNDNVDDDEKLVMKKKPFAIMHRFKLWNIPHCNISTPDFKYFA